jgi:hypothetical protein
VFSRRRFLQALAAAATLALPTVLLETANADVIEAAWQDELADPWYFEVSEFDTIVEADAAELRQPIGVANATAERLGLPFRFKAGASVASAVGQQSPRPTAG